MWLLVLLLVSSTLLAQPQSYPQPIRVEASYVKVPIRVEDNQGRALLGLTRENFLIRDEGQPRSIDNFILDRTPLHVVLMLDVSGSVAEEREEMREAALSFASEFGKEDRIAVIAFSDKSELLQDWTNDRKKLKKSLKDLETGYRTALYDAIVGTRQKLNSVHGKRVVILLTDGVDNESNASYNAAIGELQQSDVSVYVVSRTRLVIPHVKRLRRVEFMNRVMRNILNEDKNFVDVYFREVETALRYMADSTGGRALFPEKLEELSEAYKQIAHELKTQYLLTFLQPTASDKPLRSIEVSCNVPFGRLYYRQQYLWAAPKKR